MAKLIIHFIFALIVVSYLLLVSDAKSKDWPPEIGNPLINGHRVFTTSTISPISDIEQHPRCKRNSNCNGICPQTCKYKVCIHNHACDCNTCHCYLC
ncbi:hypothetical protein EUTSA_v10009527mg [Eutrema salsugineum]|uniref:Uncharacterized protein n=1 Tax=Eutrema salsugineum TaxID=72664 RepID=V4KVS1_EUTSA|nr:defensin-like protein 268 [Eutrema salsugineum]ESQ35464.1 hypothetical protein EUTSA_v10009527mg [Eutrema salsugineum]